MPLVTQVLTPAAEELEVKQFQLRALEQELAEEELKLSTARGGFHLFERRYKEVVGRSYSELEEVRAQVLEMAARMYPRSDEFQAGAKWAREQAGGPARETEEINLPPIEKNRFQPAENLKKLFRTVAKKIHPDLTADSRECARRHGLMAQLNQAYERLDEKGIQAVLIEWEAKCPSDENITVEIQLVRTVRQISQVKHRIRQIFRDMENLENSDLYRLMEKAEAAAKDGRELLHEMTAQIDKKVVFVKSRIRDLVDEFV